MFYYQFNLLHNFGNNVSFYILYTDCLILSGIAQKRVLYGMAATKPTDFRDHTTIGPFWF